MKQIVGYKLKVDWKKCLTVFLATLPIIFIILCIIFNLNNVKSWSQCTYTSGDTLLTRIISLEVSLLFLITSLIITSLFLWNNKTKLNKFNIYNEVLPLFIISNILPFIYLLTFTINNFNDTNICLKQHNLIIIFYILTILCCLPVLILILYGIYYGVYYTFFGLKYTFNYMFDIVTLEPILDVV